VDKDGDLDLCYTFYYGDSSKPGADFLLINKGYGNNWEVDTSLQQKTSGWNVQTIFADFNNDDLNDLFIINRWRKPQLLINNGITFIDESAKRLSPHELSENYSAGAVDFDNDGDLDLFVSSDQTILQIFKNDGHGYFHEASAQLPIDFSQLHQRVGQNILLNFADFNNDGFVDILINLTSMQNALHLLINDSAKQFIDQTNLYKLKPAQANISVTADFDADGDLDILTAHYPGFNKFWNNNLNEKNFIRVIPKGVLSNASGLGCKIYLYQNYNGKEKLVGYRQLGSNEFSLQAQAELVAHFGVDTSAHYNLRVKFYGGKEKYISNICPGQTIVVEEYAGVTAALIMLPGSLYRLFINRELQIYLAIIVFSILIILGGIRLGINLYHWNIKLSSILVAASVSVLWFIIILTLRSEHFGVKYGFPVLFTFFSMFLPHLLFFLSSRQLKNPLVKEKLEEELLQLFITFSHGAWALRNLNGLQLYFQNVTQDNLGSEKYAEHIFQRVKTYNDLTKNNLTKILGILNELKIESIHAANLASDLQTLNGFLLGVNATTKLQLVQREQYISIAQTIARIKNHIANLRENIYIRFSCNPNKIIEETLLIYKNEAEEAGIALHYQKEISEELSVLLKGDELAEILANLLTNALRASKKGSTITLHLYRVVPKIHIDVIDEGMGIPTQNWQKIFERGFSQSKSTGEGLFYVKQTLEKYGGRVSIKRSEPGVGTTMSLDLNEGTTK